MADDYSNNTSTTGRVSSGGSVRGSIETSADTDWFRTTLSAGTRYTFDLEGSATGAGTLADPFLRLRDASGNSITYDDDAGTGYNARIQYTPQTSGYYFLSVGPSDSGTGTYRLSVTGSAAPLPSLSVNDITVNESAGTAEFTVSLSQASNQTVSARYSTLYGTANAGGAQTDYYGLIDQTLSFSPGQTSKKVAISLINDSTNESDEYFDLLIENPTNATIADSKGRATIIDNDAAPLPSLSVNDITVNESAGTAEFTVSLSQASNQTVSVRYSTLYGTANAGGAQADYYGLIDQTLSFSPGQTSKKVAISLINDSTNESDEYFDLLIENPTNATIADSKGRATIIDNDPAPLPSLSVNDITVNEGTGTAEFTVSLSQASNQTISARYSTLYGTANAGGAQTDYYGLIDQTLSFSPGQTSKKVAISLINDSTNESDEYFDLLIENPTNATIADSKGRATIIDNDPAPTAAEITVRGNNKDILDGDTTPIADDHTDFGSVAVGGAPIVRTFTVRNDGGSTLTLGTPTVPSGFALVEPLAASLAPGASDTFQVRLDTTSAGTKNGQISFTNNDSNENPFNFSITGTVTTAPPPVTPPTLSISALSADKLEGNSGGSTDFTYSVTRTGNLASASYVDWQVVAGSADKADFTGNILPGGKLTFNANDSNPQTITVKVAADTIYENNGAPETFSVRLSNPVGATIGTSSADGRIQNDDAAPQPTTRMIGQEILRIARQHTGETYVLGANVVFTDPNENGPWDCAELVSWCAKQAYDKMIGIIPGSNPPETYTGQWYSDVKDKKDLTEISLSQALGTEGSLLLKNPVHQDGHIGISEGNGSMFSAYSPAPFPEGGVVSKPFTASNFPGTYIGVLINSVSYNIVGGLSANTLKGSPGGNDTIDGREGTDTADYSYLTASQTSLIDLQSGYATIGAEKDTLKNIENAWGGAGRDDIRGTGQANELRGNGGNDEVAGGDGDDVLYGDAGNDGLYGGNHNDKLYGGSNNDILYGGPGRDILDGGTANGERDTFVYKAVTESPVGSSRDLVYFRDVGTAYGDIIDVSAIDANVHATGNQAFTFIKTAAFSTNKPGTLRVFNSGSNTIVQLNTDNDTAAEAEIELNDGSATATSYFWQSGHSGSDFIL